MSARAKTPPKGPWRPLLAAAGVAASTIVLAFVVVNVYATILSITSGGDVDVGMLRRFAAVFGWYGVPAIFSLLVSTTAAWVARPWGWVGGVLFGLLSATGTQLLGLALGPLVVREAVVYALLGALGGALGAVAGRSLLSEQEALFGASRSITEARTPQDVAAAIGEGLAARRRDLVAVWQTVPDDAAGAGRVVERVGWWSPDGVASWPPSDLVGLKDFDEGWRLLRLGETPPSWQRSLERAGIGRLLVFLARTEGGETIMTVGLRGLGSRWGFSRRRVRSYVTLGAQVALALENLRLIEEARKTGVLQERQRLAFEIHDTLVQDLSGIVMNLETAEASMNGDSPAFRYLDRARRVAREGLVEARRLVWALRPDALERASLPETLERLAGDWSEENGARASLSVTGTPRPLPLRAEVALLRTAQEALANVRKHAGADLAVLTLSFMDDRVTLDVRDDGVGFDPAAPNNGSDNGGFGLDGMRQRAALLGGTFSIESARGAGTTLTVELPAGHGETA